VAIDRATTLKQADKLLRQGKLDGAIAEYVRLIDDQPQDWTTINVLGDLYLRAGKNDKAIEQYIRVADHQFSEGFLPKSAALYKKALKLEPDHEHILMQLAEIGERQGKFVDAKQYLKRVAQQREARGERRAAAECILRLGSLPEADLDSKLAAVRAAQQIGDGFRAVELLKEAARHLEQNNKRNEALQMLADAAEIDPFDAELRVTLAREFLATKQPKRARAYLSFETAGDDPELLLALATVEFAEGKEDDARVAMARVLALAPDREPDIEVLADSLMTEGRTDSAFACVDAITDAALLQGDAARAATALRKFVDQTLYIPALAKLAEISVEGGMGEGLRETQAQLADAYLDALRGEEARIMAEDLLRADPANDAHAERLRRALTLLGVPEPENAVAQVRSETGDPPRLDALSFDSVDPGSTPFALDALVHEAETEVREASLDGPLDPPVSQAVPNPPVTDGNERVTLDMAEIDLSAALSGLVTSGEVTQPSARVEDQPEDVSETEAIADIEDIFAQMRAKSAREQQASAALAQYEQGLLLIDQGMDAEAIAALETAARVPMVRFKAAARLGRFLIDRGDLSEGIEWLERAAETPAPSADEGHDLLYELAGALESQGESARALAVLMELDAEAEGYRDVRTRIIHLTRVQQTGSHGS
jgi:tetratricopeptide (TPR) repeat protein